MSTSTKYIQIELKGASLSGLTNLYVVRNNSGEALGIIRWMATWRRYWFKPYDGTGYDASCMREIADHCDLLTKEHKAK